MSQRQHWTFSYSAKDVLETARKRLAYHERKVGWWLDRERERETEAQKSVTLGEGYDTVQGRSTAVGKPQFDQTKLNALYEAQTHRKDHQAQADTYRTWVNVLYVQPDDHQLQLDYDDVVFFGLAEGQPVEDEAES